MALTLEQAVDHVCERINLRDRNQMGVDVSLLNAGHLERPLFNAFHDMGEKLTLEAVFGERFCFCWGETPDHHAVWVAAH